MCLLAIRKLDNASCYIGVIEKCKLVGPAEYLLTYPRPLIQFIIGAKVWFGQDLIYASAASAAKTVFPKLNRVIYAGITTMRTLDPGCYLSRVHAE